MKNIGIGSHCGQVIGKRTALERSFSFLHPLLPSSAILLVALIFHPNLFKKRSVKALVMTNGKLRLFCASVENGSMNSAAAAEIGKGEMMRVKEMGHDVM